MDPQELTNGELSRPALRRQREKQYRIHSILNAAEKFFSEKGYNRTTMEDIADLSEISIGAVYFYFKRKEDLLIRLLHDIGDLIIRLLSEEFRKSDQSVTAFNNLGLVFLKNFCLAYPEKNIIFFRESIGQNVEIEGHRIQVFTKMTNDIKNRIKTVQKKHNVKPASDASCELVAVFVVGIFSQISNHYFIWQDKSIEIMRISTKIIDFLLGGVGNVFESTPKKELPGDHSDDHLPNTTPHKDKGDKN